MSPETGPELGEEQSLAIVPKVAWRDSETADEHGDDYSEHKHLASGCKHQLNLAPDNAELLSRDILSDTFAALPLRPTQVMATGNAQIDCCVVGETASGEMAVDMQVTQKFRAYYDPNELRQAKEAHDKPIQRPNRPRLTGADKPMLLSDIVREECEGHELAALPPVADGQVSCQWIVDSSQVQLSRRLAVGGFAEVFLGQYAGTRVAVKRLFAQTNHEEFRQEVRMLAQLRHPNLLLFMGYTLYPSLSIITEYMQRGSLYNVISKRGQTPLDVKLQRSVALSVARGMAYLHSRSPPILHLDLKSANILVDNAWRVKLGDFGLSRIRINSFMSSAASSGGTPQWMAPEVLRSERYDEAADVYSFGVVLWEVLTGKAPWADMHAMQVVGAVGFQGRTLPRPSSPDADPFLVELCMLCMRHNPRGRPTFAAMVDALDEHFNHRPGSVSSLALARVTERVASQVEMESPHAVFSPAQRSPSSGSTTHGSGRVSVRTVSNASSEGQATWSDDKQHHSEQPRPVEPAEFQYEESPKMYGLFRQPSVISPFEQSEAAPPARQTPMVSPFEDGLGSPTALAEMSLSHQADGMSADPVASSATDNNPVSATEALRQESIISPFLQLDDMSTSVVAASMEPTDVTVNGPAPNGDRNQQWPGTSHPAPDKDWHAASSDEVPTCSPVELPHRRAGVEDLNTTPEIAELSPPHTPTQHPLRLQPPSMKAYPAASGVSKARGHVSVNEQSKLPSRQGSRIENGHYEPVVYAEDVSDCPDTQLASPASDNKLQGCQPGKIIRALTVARRRLSCSTK